MKIRYRPGFSLVEVVLAIGVMVFVIFTLLALLPLGLKSNQISAEETRAINILSVMEADLRNTHPLANGGRSALYVLPLPYAFSGGGEIFNTGLQLGTVTGNTVLLDGREQPASSPASRARFQATVIYCVRPSTNALGTMQARLIVNWPSVDLQSIASESQKIAALTDPGKVSGHVEAAVSFPHP